MLTVEATVDLGNLRYDTHTVALRLRRDLLPALDRLEVTLPRGVRFEAEPGDDVVVQLDGGEGAATPFTGRVTAVRRRFDGVHVVAHDGGAALARYRPSVCLEQVTVGDVIRQLCDDAQVEAGDVLDGPQLTVYVTDGRSSAAEEIARLARHGGGRATFDGSGALHVFDGPFLEELALLHGREVLDVESQRRLSDDASRTVVGEGAGEPGSALARWPIVDFLAGAAPAPGPSDRRRTEPELRTTDDAQLASASWGLRQAQAERPVRLTGWLLPKLAPGTRVEIQDLPDGVGPPAMIVRRVLHRLDAGGGAVTIAHGYEDDGSPGLLELLAKLALGALGSLL